MPCKTRTERFKLLERTLTLIIVVGCGLSLYLASISPSSNSGGLGRMRTGFMLRDRNPEAASGVFGSLFRSHDHRHIFRAQEERRRNTPNPTSSGKQLDGGILDLGHQETNIQQWFEPPSNNSRKTKLSVVSHPYLRNFVIVNSKICKDTKVDILIYFQSAVLNFQRRRILRETWANRNTFSNITIRTIFLLGRTSDFQEQMKVNNEFLAYRDVIQGDFIDNVKNLTLKSIMAFRWIAEFCAHARYVIKSDDDIFVNIFSFVEGFISSIWKSRKVIMCHVRENGTAPIERNQQSKWYVPKELFPDRKFYPRFCPGYTVLFTGDLVQQIYEASFSVPIIPVDDVYTFGLLLEKYKDVKFVDLQKNFTLNQKLALAEYTGTDPITHAVSNAWENGVMEKFWLATLERLSPWALRHASFAILEQRRLSLDAEIV